ncbi:MAG: quinolinate synthase NadA [Candidatus Thermoplasmatota archaeon]|nr:quinolinate synthase NadA [Candidatus Thermoplasmatota archaeon]MBU1941395.1 quinolinate synthase NadA [Candidatus Thermoplasmatota archaeon]
MDIIEEITLLKHERNAIILAHNYQSPIIQDVADYRGDSLELAKLATKTDAEYIVFCGVDFMAESAKILNPTKTVILPDKTAQCPMAAMVEPTMLQLLKEKHPHAPVVCYINTTAEIKALSDICCTSANGVNVVKQQKEDTIIFIPDQNLGHYIQRFVPDKKMVLWPGYCATHHNITVDHIKELKRQHPQAEVLVHPECRPEVIDIADYAYSTNGMLHYVKKSSNTEFIIGTEKEHCYRLKKDNPTKLFYPVQSAICKNMKKITAEKLLKSLKTLEPQIQLSETIMHKARKPLERMMQIGRGD